MKLKEKKPQPLNTDTISDGSIRQRISSIECLAVKANVNATATLRRERTKKSTRSAERKSKANEYRRLGTSRGRTRAMEGGKN